MLIGTEMSESFTKFYEKHKSIMDEIYIKTLPEEDLLSEGNIKWLLVEKLDQQDIDNLRAQAVSLRKFIEKIAGATGGIAELSDINGWLQNQLQSIGKAEALATKLDLEKPKVWGDNGVGKTLKGLASIQSQTAAGLAAIAGSVGRLSRNLDGKVEEDAIFETLPEDGEITPKLVQQGIEKSFGEVNKSSWISNAKGFLKAIGGASPANSKDFPFKAAAQSLMKLNLGQLKAISAAAGDGSTLPELGGDAGRDIVNTPDDQAPGEEGEGAEDALDQNAVEKAAKQWIAKLKSDGANDSLLAIGKKWITAVAKDPTFKKSAGLEEAKINALTFLLPEQIKWSDMLLSFSRNKPKEIAQLTDKNIAPIVAPFAKALSAQGLEVVGKDGKPIKIPADDLEDELDVVEDDLSSVEDEPTDESEDTLAKISDILSKVDGLKGDLEKAKSKLIDLLGIEIPEEPERVEESRLLNLLFEKTISYEEIIRALEDNLPEEDTEKIIAVKSLDKELKSGLGDKYGVTEIPGSEEETGLDGPPNDIDNDGDPNDIDLDDDNDDIPDDQDPDDDNDGIPDEEDEDHPDYGKEEDTDKKAVKKAEFISAISDAITEIPGDDEELLDMFAEKEDEITTAFVAISQDIFGDDFSLEESFFTGKLAPLLLEGDYNWEDVQKSIDANAVDIPKEVLYAVIAKALPSFEKFGVKIIGVPETSIEDIKTLLSGEELEDSQSFGKKGTKVKYKDWIAKTGKEGSLGAHQSLVMAKALANMGKAKFTEGWHTNNLSDLLFEDFSEDLIASIEKVGKNLKDDPIWTLDDDEALKKGGVKSTKIKKATNKLIDKIESDDWNDKFASTRDYIWDLVGEEIVDEEEPAIEEDPNAEEESAADDENPEPEGAEDKTQDPKPEDNTEKTNEGPRNLDELDYELDSYEEEEGLPDPDFELTPEEKAEADAQGLEMGRQVGLGAITKNELAMILKRFPDIVGSGQRSTNARRAFRKAINFAAGKTVFDESFDYGFENEEKYLLTESIEEDALKRWRKLAGIEND